jgi:methylated-DNA-[protein]-cysteine S-methyltransferase
MRQSERTCREIEPDLVALGAGEGGAAAADRVEGHVERCASCRDELARYRALDGMVGALRERALPGDDPTLARAELEARLADLRSRVTHFGVYASVLGPILIARSELGVARVRYLEGGMRSVAAQIREALGDDAVEDPEATEGLHRELLEYLDGRRASLDWTLDLRAARSGFQRRVLEATARVPYGAVMSYAGIARAIGAPDAVRPVAQALRHNPVPIVVPCHRVIGSTGALVGYAGRKVGLKQQLLAIEGVRTEAQHGDLRVPRERMYALHAGETEYCLPTCGSLSREPLAVLTLFGSRARAEAAGFAPCTSCRPDLHPLPEPA